MTIVVDASLAVKWFLAEDDSHLADDVFEAHSGDITVPPVFGVEVSAAMVREANIHKAHADVMRSAIARLISFFDDGAIVVHAQSSQQLARAADLAIDLGHPLKDCLYLTLAMEIGCELVTCDARFAAKAKGVWDRVRVLGEGA